METKHGKKYKMPGSLIACSIFPYLVFPLWTLWIQKKINKIQFYYCNLSFLFFSYFQTNLIMTEMTINWFKEIKYILHKELHVITYDFEASHSFVLIVIELCISVISEVKLSEIAHLLLAEWMEMGKFCGVLSFSSISLKSNSNTYNRLLQRSDILMP